MNEIQLIDLLKVKSEKECIELLDAEKETVALGLSEISSKRLSELLGQKEKQYDVEVVHANNLRLL